MSQSPACERLPMSCSDHSLRASYRQCRRVARRAGSSFYPSFFLLPRVKREAMYALYAFLRHTDDLGDAPAPAPWRREALARWREAFSKAVGQGGDGPDGGAAKREEPPSELPDARLGPSLLPALADTVRRYRIPVEHLHAVIDGVEMDLGPCRYETYAELEQYCHRVASAVGLACIHIWGFRGAEAIEPARCSGVAFQLTNILRDLKEDAQSGRVYLPLEDLRRFGCSEQALLAGVVHPPLMRLLEFQIARARRCYEQGARLTDYLEPDGKRVFGTMAAIYRRLLEEIDRHKADLLRRRIRLGRWQKLLIVARWFLSAPL